MMMAKESISRLRIRYATAADNTMLAEVGAETFYGTFAADNTPQNMAAYLAASFSPQKQAQELADPAARFLIAEIDGAVVGYAHLKIAVAPPDVGGRTPMEIARFYVRKAWIGKGFGAQLMKACLAEAQREGCDVAWLGVWEQNANAIAFYHKAGFVEVGTQVFQLGEDLQRDLIMVRPADKEKMAAQPAHAPAGFASPLRGSARRR
jgi:GNAT superfamily N-acetyltransferase